MDLAKGESFGFLGFDFRRVHSLHRKWRSQYTPQPRKHTALLRKPKEVFRRHRSEPPERVVALVNPILRGWVNHFRIGHSSRCFCHVRQWVQGEMRRHLMCAVKRPGFGRKRWSKQWLCDRLGVYDDYRIR